MDTQPWQLSGIATDFDICLFACGLCVCTYHMRNKHVIILPPCNLTWAGLTAAMQFEYSTGVATLSTSRGNVDVRLTKSGETRSEQLLVMPTEQLIDWEWLPKEHLNGLECSRRSGWILDMKYQTCLPMGIQVHPLNYDDSNVHKWHHNQWRI